MDNRSKPPESAPANRPRETEAVHCAGEYWGGVLVVHRLVC